MKKKLAGKAWNITKKILSKLPPKFELTTRVLLKIGYEDEVALLPYLCNRNKISIDVGANMGIHTYYLQKHSKSCIAFEPIPQLAKRLKRTFEKNVIIENVALSDKNGESTLRLPKQYSGSATIEEANQLENLGDIDIEKIIVPIKKLDDYELDTIGCIVIDVEGHEQAVLEGSKKYLSRDKPNLIIEAVEQHKPHTIANTREFLEKLGYRGFFFLDERLHDIQKFSIESHQKNFKKKDIELYIHNFIFIPEENLQKISKFLE